MLESLTQVYILQLYWRKRLRYICFLINFERYLKAPFYRTLPGDCFCSTEKHFTNKIGKSPLKKEKQLETPGKKNNNTRRKKYFLHKVLIPLTIQPIWYSSFLCSSWYIESTSVQKQCRYNRGFIYYRKSFLAFFFIY